MSFDQAKVDRSKAFRIALRSFLILGIVLRVFRYAMNFPLWSDEAFVAANFLRRGYLDLLRPLDYGQICPIVFLWAVRASTRVLGFSEFSLRLFPLLCALASLVLFVKSARNLLRGLPFLFAIAIFAVSAAPVRYASEVKPYASDLLAALMLITPALGWIKNQERTQQLWWLAALTPLALALSNPVVFVAGGISLGLASSVFRSRSRRIVVPFIAFNLACVLVFPAIYLLVLIPQDTVLPALRTDYWVDAFPPVHSPIDLLRWLVVVHSGKMLGYPGGGSGGASTLTLVLVIAGAITLWRQGRRTALAVLLGAFATGLIAAFLRRYPYGVETRTMQYLAPGICLLAGAGLDAILGLVPRQDFRRRLSHAALVGLFAGGLVCLLQFTSKPFINSYDVKARDFARSFWKEQEQVAEVACLMHDFGVYEQTYLNLYSAIYLCNQMIQAPSRLNDLDSGPHWERITSSHPLRCVLFSGTSVDHPRVKEWLDAMSSRFTLRKSETIRLDMSDPKGPIFIESIVILELAPRPDRPYEQTTSAPAGAVRR